MENTKNLPSLIGMPNKDEFLMLQTMAKYAYTSGLYKMSEAAILVILLTSRELDVPPMNSLNGGIIVINGSPSVTSRLMGLMIRRRGHLLTSKGDNKYCTVTGRRADTGQEDSITYTIEMADRAKLTGKEGSAWSKFTEDMLYCRALSRLSRRLFPDVIGNCYLEGEIEDKIQDKNLVQSDCEIITENDSPDQQKPIIPMATEEQLNELREMIKSTDEEFKRKIPELGVKYIFNEDLSGMTLKIYDSMCKGVTNNIKMNEEKKNREETLEVPNENN